MVSLAFKPKRLLQKNKSCQVLIISMAKRGTVRLRNGLHKLDRRNSSYRTRQQKKHGVVQETESGLRGATQQSRTEWIRLVSQLVGSSSNPSPVLKVALSFPLFQYSLNKHKLVELLGRSTPKVPMRYKEWEELEVPPSGLSHTLTGPRHVLAALHGPCHCSPVFLTQR